MKLTADVRAVLEAATVVDNELALVGQLDRKLYIAVAKAIELMGGKWNRKAGRHLFDGSAEDVVADAVSTGAVMDFRKTFQFFETPATVAAELVAMADIPEGARVLEPSAGAGRIVAALRSAGVEPDACELMPKNVATLSGIGVRLVGDDFLKLEGSYDRIVANPPFSGGQDVDHVTQMWRLLAPGGRLVSVMSPAWRYRTAGRWAAFRALAESVDAEWHELPAGSFVESGTSVSTGVIVMDRAA